MGELLLALQLAIAIAVGFLAIRTAASWIRRPDRRHGYLALALCSLALLILIAPILGGSGAEAQALTDIALVLFLISGYALVMFRDSFVPITQRTRRFVAAGIVLVGVFGILAQLPAETRSTHRPLQSIALAAVLIVWTLCILEPIIRFWIAARGRHAVEAARLRALSAGYAGILFLVMFGTFAPSLGVVSTLVTDLITLAVVDEHGRIAGIITADDVISMLRHAD